MIEVRPTTAFMLYLGAMLLLVLGAWCYTHFKTRKRKLTTLEKKLYVCEYCHFAYLDAIDKCNTQCPQCHSFNRR
ncbi:MAG: hypothetical protein H7A37_06075 [Chlamydiales bacterium]|nr:hypothetical protein [Chlamydiia bacterium]MCP5507849.1 hypothetical protein [Chlamydiales bacterium]